MSGLRSERWVDRRAMITGVAVLFLCAAARAETLEVRGYNTVIVNCGDAYSVAYLQHFLVKYVAKAANADAYAIDAKPKPDRAASLNFPVVSKNDVPADKIAVYVGVIDRIPERVLPNGVVERVKEARRGTVMVRREGNVIVCTRNVPDPWNLNAIRVFLDKASGVRMYAPAGANGLEWVSVPEGNSFVVDDLHIVMEPYFAKTTFSSGGYKRNAHWLRMNAMVSEGLDLRASHTITSYFPPDKYHTDHPQLFPMAANGTRPKPTGGAWNPCFADPDLSAEIAMREIREKLKARNRGYLSFGVMDCKYDCHCPVCRTSMQEMDGNAANLWYTFLNKVAKQCQEEFPGLYLTSYAYSNIGIPTGMKLEPNIVIDNVIKSYQFTNKEYWQAEERGILAFASLGARWITHDWNFEGVNPRIYSRQLAAFLQWGVQNGMLGIYTEWSGDEYWYLCGAHYWVLRQLLSDPFLETDALWRQYCRDMFGEGWEEMYRFYDMFQQKQVVADAYCKRNDWPRQDCALYLPEDLALQRKWLETAIAKTQGDAMIQKRLAAVMRYFRAHELLCLAAGEPARLYHQYTVLGEQDGINKKALAFYVNDDGSRLVEFDRYYDNKRTVAPDSNAQDNSSGIRFSYRNNYSRALGTVIAAIKRDALEGVDLAKADQTTVAHVVARARELFRANLPAEYDKKRAAEIEELVQKTLWVPRLSTLPKFDADLSDDVWQQAARLTGWTQADILVPSTHGNKTEGRIMRVADRLVIGVTCIQPKGIWAETPADIETGTRIWRESGCEFFFGPPPQPGDGRSEYFQYIVTSMGAWRGFRTAQDNRKDVTCAVAKADDGKSYTIEVAFPLKVDGLYDYSAPGAYTFNIMRNPFYEDSFQSKERIGWAPIFNTAQLPESRGLVVLE